MSKRPTTDDGRESKDGKDAKAGNEKWLDAHFDPVASLYTFTQCITLSDINSDGDCKLIIADLGTNATNIKLKVYKGTSLMSENTILDLPTGVVTFYMDTNDPKMPAIAVASGPYIYVYKNLRPYFKFTLPSLDIDQSEQDLWTKLREGKVGVSILVEQLDNLRAVGSQLTPCSLRLLDMPGTQTNEREAFVNIHKQMPLKRQTVITCMATMKKSMSEDDAISCLVIGTESCSIHVIDPEAFTVLTTMALPAVPVFLEVSGLYDVEFTMLVACRNGGVYGLKRGSKTGKCLFKLNSQPVGLKKLGKAIIVGCMDETLQSYTHKGKRQWSIKMPASIMTMEGFSHKSKNISAVLVALTNNEVHAYMDKNLIDVIHTQDTVSAMKFGKFGREDSTLIMTTRAGGLIVKMLKRTAQFDEKSASSGAPAAQNQKLDIPKKTKLFLDQTMRERENGVDIYRQFQHDLTQLKLTSARGYVNVLQKALTPISTTQSVPVKLHAEVTGIGPLFKLTLNLQNTSLNQPVLDLCMTFDYDSHLYSIHKPHIMVPMLVPGLSYMFETLIQCLSDKGISDIIKVFVIKKSNIVPVITAVINMPVSEAVVVV